MSGVVAAAVDRAVTTADPALARRHLRLVAALADAGPTAPLAAAAATTLAVGGGATRDDPSAAGPVGPPTPGGHDDAAVRGAALAVRRYDRSLDRMAASAGLPRAAVRRALARL